LRFHASRGITEGQGSNIPAEGLHVFLRGPVPRDLDPAFQDRGDDDSPLVIQRAVGHDRVRDRRDADHHDHEFEKPVLRDDVGSLLQKKIEPHSKNLSSKKDGYPFILVIPAK